MPTLTFLRSQGRHALALAMAMDLDPNKFNVLLALLCFFDRNEWGALRLGSKHQYKNLIAGRFQIQEMEYNGMLIGPDGKLNRLIADFLDLPVIKVLLGWQNPKI